MMFFENIVLATLASKAVANCAYGTSLFPRLPNVYVPNFSYDALKGPLNWYGLNETANIACGEGEHQSPIVLTSEIPTIAGSSIIWTVPDYPDGAEFENIGTTVEVVVNGTLVFNNTTFKLAQFHFHTPGEHRINDELYPMEMHWVFESEAKQYAVISFLVELCEQPSCANPLLGSLFKAVSDILTLGAAVQSSPLYFGELTSKFMEGEVWSYSGSLTTPPCLEQVAWLVSNQMLYLDLPTWLSVKKVIKYNARYTQDNLGAINLLANVAEELN